jgi:hypothetical protein
VADLPLLPFYVASSRHFLILAGATYLSRLWCAQASASSSQRTAARARAALCVRALTRTLRPHLPPLARPPGA